MHPLHIHLFLNHLPVIGGIGALLLLSWGLWRRSAAWTNAALGSLVIVGLIAIPVFLTGSHAAERVERVAGVPADVAGLHRDAVVAALVGLEATAAIAFAALFAWRTTRRYPMFPAVAALVVGIAAAVLLVRAASLCGQIRHGEIQVAREAATASLK